MSQGKGTLKISRRRFLALAGVGVGALACGGLGFMGAKLPRPKYVESECVGDREAAPVLVTYATRAGSTGEVARAIGDALCEEGLTVDVRPVGEVADLSGYGAVVLGSPAYAGNWMGEATAFLEAHGGALAGLPVAYFTVCLTLKDDTPENRETVAAYLDPIYEAFPSIEPVDVGLFAGEVDTKKLPLHFRLMMKVMKVENGDHRDWDAIAAWGKGLVRTLGL